MGSIGTDIRLNDGVTGVANSMYQSINHLVSGFERLNETSGMSFDNSAFIQAQQGFAQSIAMINQYEQELNRASQAQAAFQWNSISTPEVFNTTGIQRARQELSAAEQAARRVITNQSLISTFASRMNILPLGAQGEITNVNARVGNLGNTIRRLEREQRRLARWDTSGINQYNNRVESLTSSMGQIERLQEDINRAVSANDAGRINSSYRQLNSIIDQTEREIRNSDTSQQRLNNSITGGAKRANGLLNVYAAINLAQQGFRAGKQFAASTFGEGFNLSKIKSQFQARLGDDELGIALYKRISEQAKVSAYDINSLAKNTASFLSVAQNTQQLDKLNQFAEQLAMFDTTGQGLQGAGFSLKEALSGDIISLAERFNMSKSLIRAFGIDKLGKSGDIEGFITQFEKMLDAQRMGSEAYAKMLKDPKMQFDMFISNMKTGFAEASQLAVSSLSPIITGLNNWFASDSSVSFFNKLSEGFQWIVNKGIELFEWVKLAASSVGPNIQQIGDEFGKVGKYIMSMSGLAGGFIKSISSIMRSSGFKEMCIQLANAAMFVASGINYVIQGVAYLNERFSWLLPTVAAAIMSFTVFKALNSITTLVVQGVATAIQFARNATQLFTGATNTATVAQQGLNMAMKANPYIMVATAVMTVVASIYSLIKSIKDLNATAGLVNQISSFNNISDEARIFKHNEKLVSGVDYSYSAAQQIVDITNDYDKKAEEYDAQLKAQAQKIVNARSENYAKTLSPDLPSVTRTQLVEKHNAEVAQTEANARNEMKRLRAEKDLLTEQYDGNIESIKEQDKQTKEAEKALKNIPTDFDLPGGADLGNSNNVDNIGSVGNVGSVDKVNSPIDIESEDLKFMKEIAEQESINKYMTTVLSPELKVTFGDVNEIADLNKLVDFVKDAMENEILTSVEGLHV